MEQYNMLIVENDTPGLQIIQTDAYKKVINNTPGLIHENCGDFYSEISVNNLSTIVYEILNEEFMGKKLSNNLIVVDILQFNSKFVEIEKDYLIREENGIRIYASSLHTLDAININQSYGLLGVMFINGLFSKEKKGSLQVSYENLDKKINEILNIK